MFIQNFILGPSLFFFQNTEGVIFYHLMFTMLSNLILLFIGFLSQSKYSMLGTFRAFIHVISLDLYVTVVYVILVFSSASGNFYDYATTQSPVAYSWLFMPLSFTFIIILLLESKRAPFDHVETESEVVAGYATEFSGVYLLVFYLVEYMHLIISSMHFVILFTGS